MPPRPPPSSRAGTGRSGGGSGADSPNSGRGRPARGSSSSEDEDFSAPLTGEESYPEDGPPNPDLYGDASGGRRDETRVASVRDFEEEESSRDEDDDNSEATRAGPPVQMLVLAGPDRGRKKRFQSVRMVVGRGKDCDFVLEDQSVSRRHLELVYGEGGVVMRDLGSVSGTQVNDQRVDECVLKHGDELQVGKTRLRFVDEAEQIKEMRAQAEAREAEEKREREEAAKEAAEGRRSASSARGGDLDPSDPRLNEATNANYKLADVLRDEGKNKGTAVVSRPVRPPTRSGGKSGGMTGKQKTLIGVAGLVMVLLVVGLVFAKKRPPPPPPVDPSVERAKLLMQKARESVRAEDFGNAVRLVQEAEKLLPGVDEEGLERAAKKQQDVLDALQAVRDLIDAKKFDEAREKLTKAPEGTAKTDEERRKLEAELEEKHLAFRIQQVEEALTTRDPEAVRPLVDALPPANRPAYETKLADLEAALAKEAADEARRTRGNRERAAANAKEQRRQFIEEAFVDVERKFNGGDYQRAVLECDRVVDKYKGEKDIKDRALSLKRLIPQFSRVLDEGQKKMDANALESAAKPLRRAAELYRQIGFRGSLGNTIDEQLASSSVAAGQASLKRGDLVAAGSSFRDAMRLNPGDGRARDGLEVLQKKVEELYLQAYIQRDRDPQAAAEKFKVVIETAAEGSEVKRKAEMYLGEVQQ
ncbi:FHA domain-containing protein [Pyxidicoccus parkwayensis]|uniref:FHA domain-containing protein n=1 Tax=Pyxidicoccus parkwayensis TaxID=2813578 RepID=A0ABX7NJM3_9BACT|nr:FHA domain-containing protein [Pyxidicoccus parkwaysis]QSQ18613.1 FHA domain-containing protein [Pyxidicoccus parkwaysis]